MGRQNRAGAIGGNKMANEIKYVIFGIGLFLHACYILVTQEASFGWDTMKMHDEELYIVVIPYCLFSFWMIVYSGYRYFSKK